MSFGGRAYVPHPFLSSAYPLSTLCFSFSAKALVCERFCLVGRFPFFYITVRNGTFPLLLSHLSDSYCVNYNFSDLSKVSRIADELLKP